MKQEDIEKAAKHYQEKDHDIWTDKGITTELQKAFKAGANWYIVTYSKIIHFMIKDLLLYL